MTSVFRMTIRLVSALLGATHASLRRSRLPCGWRRTVNGAPVRVGSTCRIDRRH